MGVGEEHHHPIAAQTLAKDRLIGNRRIEHPSQMGMPKAAQTVQWRAVGDEIGRMYIAWSVDQSMMTAMIEDPAQRRTLKRHRPASAKQSSDCGMRTKAVMRKKPVQTQCNITFL